MVCTFYVLSKNIYLMQGYKYFFPKSFVAVALTFRSMIRFELTRVYEMR